MHHLRQLLSQVVGIGLAFCFCGLVGADETPSAQESTQLRRSIALNESLPFIGADAAHLAGYTGRGTTVVVIGRFVELGTVTYLFAFSP